MRSLVRLSIACVQQVVRNRVISRSTTFFRVLFSRAFHARILAVPHTPACVRHSVATIRSKAQLFAAAKRMSVVFLRICRVFLRTCAACTSALGAAAEAAPDIGNSRQTVNKLAREQLLRLQLAVRDPLFRETLHVCCIIRFECIPIKPMRAVRFVRSRSMSSGVFISMAAVHF